MQIRKLSKGFTLIEVLVALLIFVIGMLGLAGLQLKAHQSSSFAHGRTTATLGSSGLVERMRANFSGATAGNYVYDSSVDGLPAAVPTCNTAAGCGGAANMAQNDLREWLLSLDQSLPILNSAGTAINASADITVCRDATPETAVPAAVGGGIACDGDPSQWTVYIDWTDERNTTASTVKRYTFTFVP